MRVAVCGKCGGKQLELVPRVLSDLFCIVTLLAPDKTKSAGNIYDKLTKGLWSAKEKTSPDFNLFLDNVFK